MSKKHFFLYDFLLPLIVVLTVGRFLSNQFDSSLFLRLDRIKAFGFGLWFSHSPARQELWNVSSLIFALIPALMWLTWVRINLEYDWVNKRRRLDRPLFLFCRNMIRWIEGGSELRAQRAAYEYKLAAAEDRIRKLETELNDSRKAFTALQDDYKDLESDWESEFLPDSKAG